LELLEIKESDGAYRIDALVGDRSLSMGTEPASSEKGAVGIAQSLFRGGVYPVNRGMVCRPLNQVN